MRTGPRITPADIQALLRSEDPTTAMINGFLQRAQCIRNQIRGAVAEVTFRTNEANRFQEAMQLIQGLRMASMNGYDRDGVVSVASGTHDRLPDGTSAHDAHERLRTEFGITIPTDGGLIDGEALDPVLQSVQSQLQTLNSTSEMQMLNIQTLMEAQGNLYRMTSQIMNSDNQTGSTIIGNIG